VFGRCTIQGCDSPASKEGIRLTYDPKVNLGNFIEHLWCSHEGAFLTAQDYNAKAAAAAAAAADPRKRYDPLLHPLVVAAQCDDWMGATQGETPSPPRPFFRVLLAFDDAGAAAAAGAAPHAELPRCVANLAAFLGRDIGVTVASCGVEEALSLSAEPTATVTVFFLASAWAIAAWLERAPQEARARHVIVVCPCCAPRDSAIWGCLFVGACERARVRVFACSRVGSRVCVFACSHVRVFAWLRVRVFASSHARARVSVSV
jgi:hypothetical protein